MAFAETWLKLDLLFHNFFTILSRFSERIAWITLVVVSIVMSAAFPSYSIEFSTPSDVEFTAIPAKTTSKQPYGTRFYIRSNADITIYEKHAFFIRQAGEESKLLI